MDQFRFDQLSDEMDVEVVLVPFELREGIAPEGVSAASLGLGHSGRVERHIIEQAASFGFPMTLPDLLPNTHRAMLTAEAGRDAGSETHHAVHLALFGAYFGQGRDIGSEQVLLDVATGAGLDPDAVRAAWTSEALERRLRSMRQLALEAHIAETPAAIICNELLIGSRPLEVLRASLLRCVAARRMAGAEGTSDARPQP